MKNFMMVYIYRYLLCMRMFSNKSCTTNVKLQYVGNILQWVKPSYLLYLLLVSCSVTNSTVYSSCALLICRERII
jgi:hypothetical protein